MSQLPTYTTTRHHITNAPQTVKQGRTTIDVSQPTRCKNSRNIYEMKHNCIAAVLSNSIQIMTRNEMRAARHRRK